MYKKSLLFLVCLVLTGFSQSTLLEDEAIKHLSKLNKPVSISGFKVPFHFPPHNQDTTNACWSFATTSFLESEMKRLNLEPVKLAMMYAVYFSFAEKARYFIETKGSSRFAGGDLFTGVLETVQKYGMVPYATYERDARGCKTFNHRLLEKELSELMQQMKTLNLWDEELAVVKVRQILDQHLGVPPETFEYAGEVYTPLSFKNKILQLPWEDYIILTSFAYAPFYQHIKLNVPDNWAGRESYYNLPLDVFYKSFIQSLESGYTVAFDSDTGEPGRMGIEDAVFLPQYDLPGKYINQAAREFRFNNGSTTDDHLMHALAYKKISGQGWFLIKDSWRTAWLGKEQGYYYFHGDYLKLKMLAFLVHKDALPKIAKKAGL